MKKYFFLILPLFFLPGSSALAAADPEVGKPAPDFKLQDTYGHWSKLSQYHGSFVVLEWFNHECPFVKKHYAGGNMQKLQKEYTEKGVIWLSINSSGKGKQGYLTPQEANRVARAKGSKATAVLLDHNGKVGRSYGVQTTPHMFIINPEGRLIYKGAIDSIPSTHPEDLPQAVNFVRQALDEAMQGKAVSQPVTKSYGCSIKY